MATERKNIKRNGNRLGATRRPFTQGVGFGGRRWFPMSNMTAYERYLYKLGLY